MAKLKVTQVRSTIKKPKNQKLTMVALGLGRINKSIEVENSPSVLGMLQVIQHLVKVENI